MQGLFDLQKIGGKDELQRVPGSVVLLVLLEEHRTARYVVFYTEIVGLLTSAIKRLTHIISPRIRLERER